MTQRFAEIDALKAIGIVTVVLIHSLRSPFDPTVSPGEVWLGHLTRFAVPAFLIASGFLYAGGPTSGWAVTLRRLRRIAVPYLVASAAAQLFWAARGVPTESGVWWLDLLLGSSMGPYYYVVIIAGLVVVTPLFARLPLAGMWALTLALIAVQWWLDAATGLVLPFFWVLRNPLMWWAYFAAGWLARKHYAALSAWITPRRGPLGLVLALVALVLSGVSSLESPRLLVRTAAWLDVYTLCALIFTLTCRRERSPAALRYLSDTSYPIYLLHMFFVLIAADWVAPPLRRLEAVPVLVPWIAGLGGSVAIVYTLQQLLGRRSRDWIGA